MSTITAKQLREETKAVLNQLEQGKSLVITRHGRAIGRMEPLRDVPPSDWHAVMSEVWEAQKAVKASELVANPVLEERKRRRR